MAPHKLLIAASLVLSVAAVERRRQIDRLGADVLFPKDAHPKTRARHRRVMSSWRAPTVDIDAPLVTPVQFGADPTGLTDSTDAFNAALKAVFAHNTSGHHMADCSKTGDIIDLGGAVLDLQGGDYLISSPLIVPKCYGNMRIIDGAIRASKSFPTDGFLLAIGDKSCDTSQGSCNQMVSDHTSCEVLTAVWSLWSKSSFWGQHWRQLGAQ